MNRVEPLWEFKGAQSKAWEPRALVNLQPPINAQQDAERDHSDEAVYIRHCTETESDWKGLQNNRFNLDLLNCTIVYGHSLVINKVKKVFKLVR